MPSIDSRIRIPALAALAAGAALFPAAASADSIAYVARGNVWLAAPDGTGALQVTRDGNPAEIATYHSPSQADDGTLIAAHRSEIVVLRQNGEVVRRIDPPALVDSAGQAVDGAPANVAISPDGKLIAYSFSRVSCPPAASCATRSTMGYVRPDGTPVPSGSAFAGHPSFVTNTRVIAFAGFGSQVSLHDQGTGGPPQHWFDDADHEGLPGTDLGDGEVSRQGDKVALVRGYGETTHLRWYRVDGDPRSGTAPAPPRPGCQTSSELGIHGPSWSPDGSGLAAGGPEGIFVQRPVAFDDCSQGFWKLVLPGAAEPDWGPADVRPAPRGATPPVAPAPSASGGTAPGAKPDPGPADPAPPSARVRATVAPRQTLRTALRRGLTVRLSGLPAGPVRARALVGRTTVASGRAAARDGRATVRLRFTPAARRSLARKRQVRLTIAIGLARTAVTVRR